MTAPEPLKSRPLMKINVPNRPDGQVVLGADDLTLSPRTAQLIKDSTAPATERATAYVLHHKRNGFTSWCDREGRVALPATSQTLAEFCRYLVDFDRAPASIEQAVGIIRGWHRRNGHPGTPDTDDALRVIKRHRQLRAADRRSQKQAPPLDKATLLDMIEAADPSTLRGRRDQVVLVFGWQMMSRRSELVAVQQDDITTTADGLDIWIPRSKTDQDATGRTCSLPPNADPDFDPMRILPAWRALLADRGRLGGPLLWGVLKGGGGLARTPLTAHGVNRVVQACAVRAKVPDAHLYTAHSLRAGGLVDALTRGVPPGVAARHGGWDPESPMLGRYARAANRWKHNAMAGA